jgi:hypothetical protein
MIYVTMYYPVDRDTSEVPDEYSGDMDFTLKRTDFSINNFQKQTH